MPKYLWNILAVLLCVLIPYQGNAAISGTNSTPTDSVPEDSIDRLAPDFVTASLIIASPGDVLYSCVGHAFLRIQCPYYNLDYVYSYEAEDIKEKILTFLSGNLKMGMFCIHTQDYINQYRREHRGLKQYKLNLPPMAKLRLCKILDDRYSEGINLPYDYLRRGCAKACLDILEEACDTTAILFGPWPEKYKQTRREFMATNLTVFPWTAFELWTIVGTEADKDCTNEEKIVIPTDLVEVLQSAKVNGISVISESPTVLLKNELHYEKPAVTPMMVAVFIVLLAIVCLFLGKPYIEWVFLTMQTIIGLFLTYLVVFSALPATDWNWLLIPFNPLPAILWMWTRKKDKWRRYWTAAFAAMLVLWEALMFFYPHQLTDWAYTVFVLAFIIMYLKPTIILRYKLNKFKK